MSKVKVEAISLDEAINRVSNVYVNREKDFGKDLQRATDAQAKREEVDQPKQQEVGTKKLKC